MGEPDYDFVIVGSGFGGSVSALRLSEKGYSVLVLEMGKRWSAGDFPETTWNLPKYFWKPSLGLYGILQMTMVRDAFFLHGAGVGGGSLVYANTLLVPPDEAFADARWVGFDWKAALAPHYATAKKMLGAVESPVLVETDRLLRDVAGEMGRGDTFHKHTVGVYFGEPGETAPDPFFDGEGPERTGCTLCGGCMVGCRVGAKNTLDRNYLYLAEKKGAVVEAESRVVDVRPLVGGGYELEVERSTGLTHPRRVVRAKGVVFSAGSYGTVESSRRRSAPTCARTARPCSRCGRAATTSTTRRASPSRAARSWTRRPTWRSCATRTARTRCRSSPPCSPTTGRVSRAGSAGSATCSGTRCASSARPSRSGGRAAPRSSS